MPYNSPSWSKKSTFSELYPNQPAPDPQLVTSTQDSDDVSRERYLTAMRSPAPINWLSDHLREDQRLRGAVYVAIKVLGDQAASSEMVLHQWDADARLGGDLDARQPLERKHPAAQLLQRPNTSDSRGLLLRRMVQQLCLTGTSLLWRVDDGFGEPAELWSIPTGTYQPGGISAAYPDGYYTIMPWFPGPLAMVPNVWNAGGVKVDSRYMLTTRYPHPLVQQEGQSPLQACDLALDTIESIDRARFSKMRRGINPSNKLKLDPATKYPTDQELFRIKQQIYQMFGSPDKAGTTAVLGPGMDLEPYGNDAIEIGWINSWNQLVSFVLSIFGVTKSLAFMSEETSYAALYASLQQFNLFSLCPLLNLITDSFNHQLIHPYFGEDIYLELVPKKVDDAQLVEAQIANDLKVGIRTINEIRTMRGYAHVPWGEERAWIGTKTQEEGEEKEKDKAPQEDPTIHKIRPDYAGSNGSLPSRRIL